MEPRLKKSPSADPAYFGPQKRTLPDLDQLLAFQGISRAQLDKDKLSLSPPRRITILACATGMPFPFFGKDHGKGFRAVRGQYPALQRRTPQASRPGINRINDDGVGACVGTQCRLFSQGTHKWWNVMKIIEKERSQIQI